MPPLFFRSAARIRVLPALGALIMPIHVVIVVEVVVAAAFGLFGGQLEGWRVSEGFVSVRTHRRGRLWTRTWQLQRFDRLGDSGDQDWGWASHRDLGVREIARKAWRRLTTGTRGIAATTEGGLVWGTLG